MRHARRQVQPRFAGQLRNALAGALGMAGRMTPDGFEIRSGRMFHVEESHRRMEFGSDRVGDPGKGRTAMMIRHWKQDLWFGLPGSWREGSPEQQARREIFRVTPTDWGYWSGTSTLADSFFFYWYERLLTSFVHNYKGDLQDAKLTELQTWLRKKHAAIESRKNGLQGDWRELHAD
jgi:hypothetical protein